MEEVMDAIDKKQRARRINDVLAEVSWLTSLYPIDQNEDIWANLSSATVHLLKALELARTEVMA
jgi:hypothetical protein